VSRRWVTSSPVLTTVVDVANITGGFWYLGPALIEVPLTVVFVSWFLFNVLGSATWLGLVVMIVLLPVPAWTSTLMRNVQKRKMEATDARVKVAADTLNVLRMVKQFGWEEEVTRQIQIQRAEELKWIFRLRLYSLVNIAVK
jgi:ABC-type bacteriocin/lantibiotic exporter with double-glycine peptidase domain